MHHTTYKQSIFCDILIISTLLCTNIFAQYTWVDSTDASGNVIRMKVNNKTGVPHRIYGLDVNFNRYGHITEQNVQGLSGQFIREHAELLKIEPGAMILKAPSIIREDGMLALNNNINVFLSTEQI